MYNFRICPDKMLCGSEGLKKDGWRGCEGMLYRNIVLMKCIYLRMTYIVRGKIHQVQMKIPSHRSFSDPNSNSFLHQKLYAVCQAIYSHRIAQANISHSHTPHTHTQAQACENEQKLTNIQMVRKFMKL